ncbi:MAG: VOC family protein [Actinomycetota bacterium]
MTTNDGLGALRNLDYTMLLCEDLGPMRSFYVDVLGLAVKREVTGRYLELQVGAATLALRLRSRPYDGPPRTEPGASVQLAFRVPPADVDAAAEQLVERGVELLEPVHDLADFGHRVLFVADPDGNVVEIYAEI